MRNVIGALNLIPLIFAAILSGIGLFAQPLHAQPVATSDQPLPFKTWKDQQILEAQNQLTRATNQIVLSKNGRLAKTPGAPSLTRLERDLGRAEKSLDFARNLGVEEYLVGYLTQISTDTATLNALAGQLTREQVAELLQVLIRINRGNPAPEAPPESAPSNEKMEASARTSSL
jgi:hypothetical protein